MLRKLVVAFVCMAALISAGYRYQSEPSHFQQFDFTLAPGESRAIEPPEKDVPFHVMATVRNVSEGNGMGCQPAVLFAVASYDSITERTGIAFNSSLATFSPCDRNAQAFLVTQGNTLVVGTRNTQNVTTAEIFYTVTVIY